MTHRAVSVVNVVLIAFACTASADWQYTTWGMTVDEVIESSDGRAMKVADTGRDSETQKTMATAPFVAGDFVFEADFMFSRTDSKLRSVSLKLKEGNGNSLYASLVNRYGEPVNKTSSEVHETARWVDEENNNSVFWLMIGGASTSVRYQELIGETEKRL